MFYILCRKYTDILQVVMYALNPGGVWFEFWSSDGQTELEFIGFCLGKAIKMSRKHLKKAYIYYLHIFLNTNFILFPKSARHSEIFV
jgi:hypothetical protein